MTLYLGALAIPISYLGTMPARTLLPLYVPKYHSDSAFNV